jgi:hypothetical protein
MSVRKIVEFSVLDVFSLDNLPRYVGNIVLLGHLINSTLCLWVINDREGEGTVISTRRLKELICV